MNREQYVRIAVLAGYAANFLLCWAVASLVWVVCDGLRTVGPVSPFAPLYFSFQLMGGRMPLVGVFVLTVTSLALGFLLLALFHARRPVTIVGAHLCLVFYWLWTFGLCRMVGMA